VKALIYTYSQKKRASTKFALALSEVEAARHLIEAQLFREAVVHMYFACFYVAQALLAKHLKSNPSHKGVERELHRRYGTSRTFPRRYVKLHSALHELRNEFDYRSAHSPSPKLLLAKQRQLEAYLRFAGKVVPRIRVLDILEGLLSTHGDAISDLSFDIYCPATYAHHTRLTMWQPPFYLRIFGPEGLGRAAHELLKQLRVRRHVDYVVGLNSRVNQYGEAQLILLDIDTVDPEVESALRAVGGILLKSGRGFHFLGHQLLPSEKEWRRTMQRLSRSRSLRDHLDQTHVAISLRRGYSTLRVTSSPIKQTVPFFYKEL
jgi:uncharacterized protein (UPF0332 family)